MEFEPRKNDAETEKDEKMEKLRSQQETLSRLGKSSLDFYIFGGWAGKIEGAYGDDYYPSDIDIYIDQYQLEDWKRFFDSENFSIKEQDDKLQIVDQKTGAYIDGHLFKDEKGHYVEQTSYGTFQLPKTGFEKKILDNSAVNVMRPELSYIIERGGPLRPGKDDKIRSLEGVLDQEYLKEIEREFKYTSPEQSE